MNSEASILNSVRESGAKTIWFLPHAMRRMPRPDRMISVAEVRNVIESGDVTEECPEDVADTVV